MRTYFIHYFFAFRNKKLIMFHVYKFIHHRHNSLHSLTWGRVTQASLAPLNARCTKLMYKLRRWAKCKWNRCSLFFFI